MSSYHDVKVYIGNVVYIISDNYALHLSCSKAAGWRLWQIWNNKEQLLGGEFDGEPFCIEVSNIVICGVKPEVIEQPRPFGWDGKVQA